MEPGLTALDVLSRAASMVETNDRKGQLFLFVNFPRVNARQQMHTADSFVLASQQCTRKLPLDHIPGAFRTM